VGGVVLVWALASLVVAAADAEQASEPASPAAGLLDAGGFHSCAVVVTGSVRCWGYGGNGQLGYRDTSPVGDDETPASVGPVGLGGHAVRVVAAGDSHTCAILDDGSVRCWGYGADGRLGYGSTNDVLDPGLAGPVNLGPGRTATAITAGSAHTCAILDDGTVRCWGFGGAGHQFGDGRLGYGNTSNVGDTPASTPATAGPVNLGPGRTAVAISAGGAHTCAILDNGSVRCWGFAFEGQLGYGNTMDIGGVYADYSTQSAVTTTPDMAGPVNLGPGRTAIAISAGSDYTCVILDDHTVECWGSGAYGELGYGNTNTVGNTPATIPAAVGPMNLGPGRTALAISAGAAHTCAILDDHSVRCWGQATYGRLGYPTLDSLGNQASILDPSTVGAVDLGPGRTAVAISAGGEHTCARLDDGSVRCWGRGTYGRLGYCSNNSVGETDTPGSVGPVNLMSGDGGATCPGGALPGGGPPGGAGGTSGSTGLAAALRLQAVRARAFRGCLNHADRQPRRRRAGARRACVHRWGRTPGPVSGLQASGAGETAIALFFNASGTGGNQLPPARGYVIKQSRRPIRTARDFRRAQALCGGDCVFAVNNVGDPVFLIVTQLLRHTTYYYAIRPRDNVTNRCGPRSQTVKATTSITPSMPNGPGTHDGVNPQPLPNHRADSCEALG
jgi:alpha-tubulin suppressor-like RCC1 family protein